MHRQNYTVVSYLKVEFKYQVWHVWECTKIVFFQDVKFENKVTYCQVNCKETIEYFTVCINNWKKKYLKIHVRTESRVVNAILQILMTYDRSIYKSVCFFELHFIKTHLQERIHHGK